MCACICELVFQTQSKQLDATNNKNNEKKRDRDKALAVQVANKNLIYTAHSIDENGVFITAISELCRLSWLRPLAAAVPAADPLLDTAHNWRPKSDVFVSASRLFSPFYSVTNGKNLQIREVNYTQISDICRHDILKVLKHF